MLKDELEKVKKFCEAKIQEARYKITESQGDRDMNYYIGVKHAATDILHELNGIKTDA